MKMSKSGRRTPKLKGAVLIMVLTVMFVLIIMLAGAMTIVSTASNRAYTKFEESQAYYTARSGLDLVTDILMTDAVHKDKGSSNDGNNTKTANVINASNKSQGLVLQEAIVGVLEDGTNAGEKVYDVSKSLTAWDPDDTTTTYTQAQKEKSYIIFDVSDMTSMTAGKNGMLASPGDGSVQVKLQLLELTYDNGTPAGIKRNNVTSAKTANVAAGDEVAQYIKSCKLKVSCTSKYMGTVSTVSVILSPYTDQKNATVGVVSTGSISTSASSNVLGGATSAGSFKWPNTGKMTGSAFSYGTLSIDSDTNMYFGPGESVVSYSNFNAPNPLWINNTAPSDGVQPFVYIDGTFSATSNTCKVGSSSAPMDVVCGNFSSNAATTRIYGNMYIDGFLKLDMGGINLSSTDPIFQKNLFISDRTDGTPINATNWNTEQNKKSSWGDTVSISPSADNKSLVMTVSVGSKIFSDIVNNSGKGFCGGDIYYYYEEILNAGSGVTDYNGCFILEAIRRKCWNMINEPTDSDYLTPGVGGNNTKILNINNFLGRLHPSINNSANTNNTPTQFAPATSNVPNDYNNLKYIVQLAKKSSGAPDFIEKFKLQPAGGGGLTTGYSIEIEDDPTYKLKVSLPNGVTTRTYSGGTNDNAVKLVPTLLGQYKDYVFINNEKKDGSRWNPSLDNNVFLDDDGVTEIVNFTYWDSILDSKKTTSWKNVITQAALAVQNASNNPRYNYTKVREVINALNTYSPPNPCTIEVIKSNIVYWPNYSCDYSYVVKDLNGNVVPSSLSGDTLTYSYTNDLGVTINYSFKVDGEKYYAIRYDESGNPVDDFNVCFLTPALMAHVDNDIHFTHNGSTDYSSVAYVDQTKLGSMTYMTGSSTTMNNKTTRIDTSSNDVILMLSPGQYQNGKVVAEGSHYVYVMMPKIGSGANYTFEKFSVITKEYEDAYPTAVGFRVGTGGHASYTKLKTPKVMYYLDDGVTVNAYNGSSTIMGYMFGPKASLAANVPCGQSKTIDYEGTNISSCSMDYIGSAFVGDVAVCNQYSFIYVPPTDEPDPGTPSVKWRSVVYTNQDIVIPA